MRKHDTRVNHSARTGTLVDATCGLPGCGKAFQYPLKMGGKTKYCSADCAYDAKLASNVRSREKRLGKR